ALRSMIVTTALVRACGTRSRLRSSDCLRRDVTRGVSDAHRCSPGDVGRGAQAGGAGSRVTARGPGGPGGGGGGRGRGGRGDEAVRVRAGAGAGVAAVEGAAASAVAVDVGGHPAPVQGDGDGVAELVRLEPDGDAAVAVVGLVDDVAGGRLRA